MVLLSEKQQRDLLIAAGLADFLVGGKLTAVGKKAVVAALKAMRPVVASEARGFTRLAARGVMGAARAIPYVARTNPYSLAAALLVAGYIKRDEIAEVGAAIADDPRTQAAYEELLERGQAGGQFIREQVAPVVPRIPLPGIRPRMPKRKVSKANRAVKQAMSWLKAGGKQATGAVTGTLPTKAFKTAVKAAGLANPKTKSKPGKGKSIINKIARRLKKWW